MWDLPFSGCWPCIWKCFDMQLCSVASLSKDCNAAGSVRLHLRRCLSIYRKSLHGTLDITALHMDSTSHNRTADCWQLRHFFAAHACTTLHMQYLHVQHTIKNCRVQMTWGMGHNTFLVHSMQSVTQWFAEHLTTRQCILVRQALYLRLCICCTLLS